MQEKQMVLDILSGVKASIGGYGKIITECNCPNLRQTFQQMRDGDEKFQYDLYKMAEQKGYYHKSPPANQQDSANIKNVLQQGMQQMH
ncbi:MAG: spore coat protein [Defluviitaleaceae bacterium]|nr:spore coat protein [Defluviitaleaceae bacterium]